MQGRGYRCTAWKMPPGTGPVSHPEKPKCPRGRLNRARDSLPGGEGPARYLVQSGAPSAGGHRGSWLQGWSCPESLLHPGDPVEPPPHTCSPTGCPQESGHWATVGAELGKSRLPRSRLRGEAPKWGCSPDAVHRPRACQGTWSSCQDPQNMGGSRGRQTDLGVTPGGPSPGLLQPSYVNPHKAPDAFWPSALQPAATPELRGHMPPPPSPGPCPVLRAQLRAAHKEAGACLRHLHGESYLPPRP